MEGKKTWNFSNRCNIFSHTLHVRCWKKHFKLTSKNKKAKSIHNPVPSWFSLIHPDFYLCLHLSYGFPGGSVVKNLPANAGSTGLIPGLERTPGEGNDSPLQDSCLGNSVDRGAWQTPLQFMGSQKGQTQLSNEAKYLSYIYTYIYVYIYTHTYIC